MPSFGGYVDIVAGTDAQIQVGQGGIAGVLLGNESGLSCVVKMGANYSRSLYPGWVDYFPVPAHQFSGVITVTPQAKLNNAATWPSSFIQVDVLGLGEVPHGTYPAPLVRSSNIGNSVVTSGTGAVSNTTSAPGTPWLTIQPTGAASATWSADSSGNMTIKSDNAGTLITILQLIAGANPTAQFFGGPIFDQFGHIIMPNNITLQWQDASNNAQKILVLSAANETHLRAGVLGGKIVIADQDDSAIATFTSAGMTLNEGTIALLNGSVSRISKFSGTAPNTSTAFNHGLGAVPDIVLLQVTGTSSALSMVKYDVSSLTTTQVSIVSDSSRAFVGLAIKF